MSISAVLDRICMVGSATYDPEVMVLSEGSKKGVCRKIPKVYDVNRLEIMLDKRCHPIGRGREREMIDREGESKWNRALSKTDYIIARHGANQCFLSQFCPLPDDGDEEQRSGTAGGC